MNYYSHHIGDYARATTHLSLLEHGVYFRLLTKYYLDEKPLPVDVKAVVRMCGARSKEEVSSVTIILHEFFTLEDDGWHNKRADQGIEAYKAKQDKARASANARWEKENFDANAYDEECERYANASSNHCDGNANHKPITNNHKPRAKSQEKNQDQERRSRDLAPQAAPANRGARLSADWHPSQKDLDWAAEAFPRIDASLEVASFRDYWVAKAGKDGVKLDWSATFRNWMRNAKPRGFSGKLPSGNKQIDLEERNRRVADEWLNGAEDAQKRML